MNSAYMLGPVMFDLAGTALTAEDTEKLLYPAAGGIILFTRNYESPRQLEDLIASIRSVRPELLMAVDQEGGRVQRFREGFTRLPPADWYRKAGETSFELTESAGWQMASELLAVGVDFSFAPVLDVECGISRVIGDRAFADQPELAGKLALAFKRGMQTAGMAAVGKHFPGHGSVVEDSHFEHPVDRREFNELEERDLVPFKMLINQGLEGIMASHVVYEKMDSNPAGYSSFWLKDILRNRLGFRGAVFTDDLSMAGAKNDGSPAERATRSLESGCDMVVVCNDPAAAGEILESLSKYPMDTQLSDRLKCMIGKKTQTLKQLQASPKWQHNKDQLAQLSSMS